MTDGRAASVAERRGDRQTLLGRTAVASGVIGALAGVLTLVYPDAVTEETWSHPFPFGVALVVAVVLALSHVMTGAGYYGVRAAEHNRAGRASDIALRVAIAGLVLLSVAELMSGAIGREADDSAAGGAVGGLFGVASLLIGVGSLVAGFAGGSPQGAPRSAARGPLIAAGAILLLAVTPAQIAGSPEVAVVALIVWSLTFVALGLAVMAAEEQSSTPERAGSAPVDGTPA